MSARPPPGRPLRFVLLCHQRSGSNALQAMLNADGQAFVHGQLFNQFWRYRRAFGRKGIPAPPRHPEAILHFGTRPGLRRRAECALLDRLPASDDAGEVAEAFWRVQEARDAHPRRARGYKLHGHQVSDADLARLATEHADAAVLLSRENLLRAAVSWGYAKKTDVWSTRGRRTSTEAVHRLDVDELRWFVEKTEREVEGWRRVLRGAGAEVIELGFERHVETRDLGGLHDALGLDWRGRPAFETRRLAKPGYAHVSNAREIDAALGSARTGRLFD